MMIKNLLLSGFIGFLLSGCSGTTVVLLPDDAGKVGKVIVENQAGSQTLASQHESTSTSEHSQAPEKSQILSKAEIGEQFADVLAVQPEAPSHKTLDSFGSGSADVSGYAREIHEIAELIKYRKSCDVIVIGHCDTVGSNADNEAISKARASNVKEVLIEQGIAEKCLGEVRFYGESDLAKQTGDNIDEPLNRRVEVEIR